MEASVSLKSNRCATSFAAWLSALSTSWRSTLLTMSNERVRAPRLLLLSAPAHSARARRRRRSLAGRLAILPSSAALLERRSRHGRLPEWPKGAVCKTVGTAYVGSNPTPATTGRPSSSEDGRWSLNHRKGRPGDPGRPWAWTRSARRRRQVEAGLGEAEPSTRIVREREERPRRPGSSRRTRRRAPERVERSRVRRGRLRPRRRLWQRGVPGQGRVRCERESESMEGWAGRSPRSADLEVPSVHAIQDGEADLGSELRQHLGVAIIEPELTDATCHCRNLLPEAGTARAALPSVEPGRRDRAGAGGPSCSPAGGNAPAPQVPTFWRNGGAAV